MLTEIFKERYGLPTEQTTEEVKARAGATFTNLKLTWSGKKLSIFFRQRDSKVDIGKITYETEFWIADQTRRMRETIKKEAQGL